MLMLNAKRGWLDKELFLYYMRTYVRVLSEIWLDQGPPPAAAAPRYTFWGRKGFGWSLRILVSLP